jgi:CRP-like cAMP-binding protein
MQVIEDDFSLEQILDLVIQSQHSRFPVVGESSDDVLGILLAKELLPLLLSGAGSFDLKSMLRPATIIPESKRLNILLQEFREHRYHMAIVVDEYGRSVSVGESERLSRAKYTTTIRAVRDTQVAQVPESVFTYITRKHPEVLSHVTRLVAQRMAREHGSGGNGMTRRPSSLSTVALLPVSDGMTVIFAHFVSTLELALGHACSVRVLNSAAMDTELRRGTFDMISFDDVYGTYRKDVGDKKVQRTAF